ncbi:MAG: hypothetical protein K2J39_05665 [Ruminococcus sp.]|nr:hypothetical protein [Ruminococcus sp.]
MYMACKFVKILNVLIICIMMLLTGCGKIENEVSPESSEGSDMDKIIFYATILHNYQDEKYTDSDIKYYFVVQNDGTVCTMENNCNYEFARKFDGRDSSAWELAENLENIGSLSAEDTQKLSEYISGIDLNSEDYDSLRDDGSNLDVIDSFYYTYKCLVSDVKKWFTIMDAGSDSGAFYKTYDENALSAVKLIENSRLFVDWKEKINRIN